MKRGRLKWYLLASGGIFVVYLIKGLSSLPQVRSERIASNQASAQESLQEIYTSEQLYAATYQCGYSSSLASMGPPASGNSSARASGLLDTGLASGSRSGYRFTYTPASRDRKGCYSSYTVVASPNKVGETGIHYYFVDETGIIRQNPTHAASGADSPVHP